MKIRLKFLVMTLVAIGLIGIISGTVWIVIDHYESYTIIELQEICLEYNGKWDDVHNTCDRIDPLSCDLMDGEFQECKSREYKCPLDNPNCTTTMSCIATCLFKQSLSANDFNELVVMENEN